MRIQEWRMLAHLHHDAQVFDVVLLCLNQLVQNKPEQNKHSAVTSAETATQWYRNLLVVVVEAEATHIRPLIALALCSSSGFRGWTGVVCSCGEREEKPGYAPGSRV